ncbi:membrane protein [Pseudomonas syringae]|uniref:Membrane protein n=1 Tax=Pseudomonas syringae TaxID=317 RepID=A0A0L1MK19_PSESX|nr:membrane protein [Pseudomonas syringae]
MIDLLSSEKTQGSLKQLVRYVFVGIVTNFTGYLVYLLVIYLGATPKITMTVLYGVGAAIGYIGNRNFTFAHKGNVLSSGIRYSIAHFFGYSINLIILIIFVDKLGYAHQWVQAIAIFIVAGFLFTTFKFFVFTKQNVLNSDRI